MRRCLSRISIILSWHLDRKGSTGAVPGKVANLMAVVAIHVVSSLILTSLWASASDVALLVAVSALDVAFALSLGAVAGDVALVSAVVALNALVWISQRLPLGQALAM